MDSDFAGTAAIILTAGAATPIVVTACVSVSKAVNGVAGASKSTVFRIAAKTIAKERAIISKVDDGSLEEEEFVSCYKYVPLDDLTELYKITTTAIFKGEKCGIFRVNPVEDGMIWIMVTHSADNAEIFKKNDTGYVEKYGGVYDVLVDIKDVELVERREDYDIKERRMIYKKNS